MFQEGTIILFPADSVQSFLRTPCPPGAYARLGNATKAKFSSNPMSSGVVLILQGRTPDRCLCRVFGPFVFGYVNNFRPS